MAYLHAYYNQPHAQLFGAFDLETGKEIENVEWADDETGEYCIFWLDQHGNFITEWNGGRIDIKREVKKGNIKLVYKGEDENP